jgi:hypothetical protein
MFCPKCRAEFRKDVSRCANCERDLVEALPDEDPFSTPEGMAQLIGERDIEAVIVGNYVNLREWQRELARRRVPSVIAGEADGEEQPQVAVHSRFFLMVAEDDLEGARQVLDERWKQGLATEGLTLTAAGGGAADETTACPACGTPVPESATACPECELFLGAAEE